MASLKLLNPKSEIASKTHALAINISAAKGLMEVLKSNLGPRGTIKMLVGGAGDIKLTKDGNVLLHEMQIQHPTAALIARSATAQDDITGDGTTTNVLLIGELLKQSERLLAEGLHPRNLTEGFDLARTRVLEFLEKFKMPRDTTERELLLNVARSALRTKLQVELADQLTEIVVDALLTIRRPEKPLDLFMVELMTMKHRVANESRLVKGLVLDHGARHPDMPKRLENCFVLTCNVSLEYEKSEVTAETKYADVAQRQKLVDAERRVVDDRVRRVIDLKRKVCDTPDKHFVVINQKGIDPMSLDMLAKEGILALRRAKRRNMERLTLACGGQPVNSFDDLTPDVLGRAGLVYEQVLGEDKYTFVEGVENPQSVTILLKAPTDYQLNQMKDAVRDGLRAVKNALEDACLVPGAGAFELAASLDLQRYADQVQGRARRGVLAYADALLVVPRTLAENAGLDPQDSLLALQDEHKKGHVVGLDLATGLPLDPVAHGIWDLYRVKRHVIQAATIVAQQLLLVDEILKAGKATGKDAS